jgi:hypothetical protein
MPYIPECRRLHDVFRLEHDQHDVFCLIRNPKSLTHSAMNPLSSGTSKRRIARAGAVSELILHPAERRMRPVFDLDPMPEPAAAI